jgi:hypothetical protein
MAISHDESSLISRLRIELVELLAKCGNLALGQETQDSVGQLKELSKNIADKQKLYLAMCRDVVMRDAKPKPKK